LWVGSGPIRCRPDEPDRPIVRNLVSGVIAIAPALVEAPEARAGFRTIDQVVILLYRNSLGTMLLVRGDPRSTPVKTKIVSTVAALLLAANVYSLPPPANACNTPAAAHNPHCQTAPSSLPVQTVQESTSVPAPGALLLFGSAALALMLRRRLTRR
jgi:hypothetical protein